MLRLPAGEDADEAFEVLDIVPRAAPVPMRRGRRPVREDDLVVVVLDAADNELSRTVIADPRVVRGEFFDAAGRIERKEQTVKMLRSAVATVVYPDHEEAHRLVVLEPVREAGRYRFDEIARAALP